MYIYIYMYVCMYVYVYTYPNVYMHMRPFSGISIDATRVPPPLFCRNNFFATSPCVLSRSKRECVSKHLQKGKKRAKGRGKYQNEAKKNGSEQLLASSC